LTAAAGRWLVRRARQAIAARLGIAHPRLPPPDDLLRAPAACFVTLTLEGQLRGCIGTLSADAPLCEAVVRYAERAAFDDPRFPPLSAREWPRLEVEVSVLSASTPLHAASEAELLAQLRPGEHGLTIERGTRRATFLPQVWANLPQPADFLRQLKRKAGLADEFPVADLDCAIYTVNCFAD